MLIRVSYRLVEWHQTHSARGSSTLQTAADSLNDKHDIEPTAIATFDKNGQICIGAMDRTISFFSRVITGKERLRVLDKTYGTPVSLQYKCDLQYQVARCAPRTRWIVNLLSAGGKGPNIHAVL